MKSALLPFVCLGLWNFGGCYMNAIHGSGTSKTESRTVSSFSKIDLAGSPDVEVSVGHDTSLTVTADDNILPIIETTVDRDTLRIDSKQSYSTRVGVKVKIEVPTLEGISISGSGNIHAAGLKSAAITTQVTGSGNITLKGTASDLSVRITGSGNVRANELDAKSVDATVTGSGNAYVSASERLDVRIVGSGDIKYTGNPRQVRKSITGSGGIHSQ